MEKLVVENPISGLAVYGVQQVQYTVDGMSGQDFAAALTAASFRQSTAIEDAASSYTAVVRQRQRKVDDLGNALAVLAKALATMTTDEENPSDKSDADAALAKAASTVAGYGITSMKVENNQITRGDAMKAQNDIQYALDMEDNQLQQDTVSLQSMMTKRDNAFSNASKIVKKSLNASASTIENMG